MKKSMLIQQILANYVIFLILRYVNIFIGFGLGLGAAPHYQKWYVTWLHLPSLLIHLLCLFYIGRKWPKSQVVIIAIFLIILFLLSQYVFGNLLLLPK